MQWGVFQKPEFFSDVQFLGAQFSGVVLVPPLRVNPLAGGAHRLDPSDLKPQKILGSQ